MLKYINQSAENLYKSLAIGSLLVVLVGSVLMAAELQSVATEQSRLDAQISMYNLMINLSDHAHAERTRQHLQDSASFANDQLSIAQARTEQREYGMAVQFLVGAKNYTIRQFEDSITKDYRLKASAYAAQRAKEQRQGLLDSTAAKKRAEQQAQQAANLFYYKVLLGLWVTLLLLSGLLGRYGYRKWKEQERAREDEESMPVLAPRGRQRPIL